MCAVVYSSLFLMLVCCYSTLEAEGLPLRRRGRGNPGDLIAGKDFLGILMDSPALRRPYRETTTRPPGTPAVTLPTSVSLEYYTGTLSSVGRESKSTHLVPLGKFSDDLSDYSTRLLPTPIMGAKSESSEFSDSPRIITVRITSTVEEGPSNIVHARNSPSTEQAVHTEIATDLSAVELKPLDDTMLPSEEHPSIIAEVNKSEFNVEEAEPITSDSESLRYTEDLPANVQAIPSPRKLSDFQQTSELLKDLSREKLKDKLQPYHHTVIYHDSPGEPDRSRSVSYSTVIQTVPHEESETKTWDDNHGKESKGTNSNGGDVETNEGETQLSKHPSSVAESNDYYVTSKYNPTNYGGNSERKADKKENNWEKSEEPTEKTWGISERRYGMQQKSYTPKETSLPEIYGQPEQNYEVDEAVSVQTNGRSHGVQPSRPISDSRTKSASRSKNTKKDDSPKVGYVLEGRKERRYRVEERTSDGFIVGEYGIVNHDDGLLRGVRYTADGTISPRLIYDTLMKFLSL